tara:strand:- start:44 stop:565 length:522 start_codon:yes stop_codon:yes gene_type:complete
MDFLENLMDQHPLSKAERMLTGNPITSNYAESVFTGDANISLDEFSPQAQTLLTEIVNAEAQLGNNSIGPNDIKKYLPANANTNISSLKAITNPSPYDEIWFTLGKFDTVAAPQHNEFYIEDTYDTSPGYSNMMLRGLSAVDRFAQKYIHGNKPKKEFRMSIPMLTGNRTSNP